MENDHTSAPSQQPIAFNWNDDSAVRGLPAMYGSLRKAAAALGVPKSTVKDRFKAAGGRAKVGVAAGRTDAGLYYEGPNQTPPEAWNELAGGRGPRIEEGPDWQPFDNVANVGEIRARYLALTDREEYALTVPVEITERDYYTVVDASDIHLGPIEIAYRRWLALLEWTLQEPDTGLVINGDLLNMATKGAPGLGPATDRLSYAEGYALMESDLRPLAEAHKLHAILNGNHCSRIARDTGIDISPLAYMCRSLKVAYCGYETFIRWNVKWHDVERVYVGYHSHGNSNANTNGAVHTAIERMANRNRGDYCTFGHVHRRFAENLTWREVDKETGRIITMSAPMVASGSYQKLMHGTYSADHAMQPADLGAGTVWLYGSRQAVHART